VAKEKTDTRSKILEAAAEIIGRERNLNFTIREVANRAKVNIASINYYFRSKENLLGEIEMLLMERTRLIYSYLSDESLSPRDRLIGWADELIKHLIEYPGIIYLIGTKILERESTFIGPYLDLLETDLAPLVKNITGLNQKNLINFKVLQLISGVVYPVLIFSSAENHGDIDIRKSNMRLAYINSLIDSIKAA
jgi:TetR/AcrR family transcriptional regulator, regulator of cefoperazone and chloramphenicol sensitivity